MQIKIAPAAAAIAMAAGLALAGCGPDPKSTAPGVGQPNPNGKGLVVARSGKTPAQTQENAARDDVRSFKEFKELIKGKSTIAELTKFMGTYKIAYGGPNSGNIIFPNVYYDGWFVESVMIELPDKDFRGREKDVPGMEFGYVIKEIPFIRPDQVSWFEKTKEYK